MKADIELRKSMEGINPCVTAVTRKIQKTNSKKKHCSSSLSDDKDKAEIKAYLNKLQELVPFMPKNKKLSKVEVISYVIEYIRELRVTLGLPPCNNSAFPDFEDMDMEHSSPALMMTMAMMTTSGQLEHSSSTTLTTSISGAAPVSPATTNPQQSNLNTSNTSNSRQPLGVILNPRNCTNGSLISSPSAINKSGVSRV